MFWNDGKKSPQKALSYTFRPKTWWPTLRFELVVLQLSKMKIREIFRQEGKVIFGQKNTLEESEKISKQTDLSVNKKETIVYLNNVLPWNSTFEVTEVYMPTLKNKQFRRKNQHL